MKTRRVVTVAATITGLGMTTVLVFACSGDHSWPGANESAAAPQVTPRRPPLKTRDVAGSTASLDGGSVPYSGTATALSFVIPKAPTKMRLPLEPQSRCLVTNPAIMNDTGSWIVTDEDGVATLHVDSSAGISSSPVLNFACETAAVPTSRANYVVTLSPGDSYSGPPLPASSIHWDTLPPLGSDAGSRTQQQLTVAGYPPQPDPVAAPDAYAKWGQNYSRPVRYRRSPFAASVPAKGTAEQGTTAFYSNAQCGGEVNMPYAGQVYTSAFATIQTVPTVFVANSPSNAAAIPLYIWVGIDLNPPTATNHANYQGGIAASTLVASGTRVTFYSTYYENPQLPSYPDSYEGYNNWAILTGADISPGDEVSMEVWPCDQYTFVLDTAGGWGCVAVGDNNYPGGPVLWEYQVPTTPEFPYGGGEISFIVERPEVNNSHDQLPQFSTFQINSIGATGGHASITNGEGVAKTVWVMTADGNSASNTSSDYMCDPALDSDNRLNPKFYHAGNGPN